MKKLLFMGLLSLGLLTSCEVSTNYSFEPQDPKDEGYQVINYNSKQVYLVEEIREGELVPSLSFRCGRKGILYMSGATLITPFSMKNPNPKDFQVIECRE